MYTSGLCKIKFHLLDSLVRNVKRLGGISVLYSSALGKFNIQIKTVYGGSFGRRATCMQKTMMFLGWQRID